MASGEHEGPGPDAGLNVEELVAFLTLHSPFLPEFEKTGDAFDVHSLNSDTGTEIWLHLHPGENQGF